jgi:hypothetical protein
MESLVHIFVIIGLKQLGVRDLSYKHVFMANHVESTSNRFDLSRKPEDEVLENDEDESREQEARLKQFSEQDL